MRVMLYYTLENQIMKGKTVTFMAGIKLTVMEIRVLFNKVSAIRKRHFYKNILQQYLFSV